MICRTLTLALCASGITSFTVPAWTAAPKNQVVANKYRLNSEAVVKPPDPASEPGFSLPPSDVMVNYY
jgi:hypothetical protein